MSHSRSPDAHGSSVVVTTTGAYNVDYEAAYAARKFDQRSNRFGTDFSPSYNYGSDFKPRELSREEILKSLDDTYKQERSKSNEKPWQ